MKIQLLILLSLALFFRESSSFIPVSVVSNHATFTSNSIHSNIPVHNPLAATTTSTATKDESKAINDEQKYDNGNITNYNKLLEQALKSNQTSAQSLLDKLTAYRQNQDQDGFDLLLNNLLSNVEPAANKNFPFWTKVRIAAKFSKRARKASLLRVIDLSTLNDEEEEEVEKENKKEKAESVLSSQSRRRRSLLLLLRSLADREAEAPPSIYKLEKIAVKEAKKRISPQDVLGRIPEDLETPKYKVLKTDYTSSDAIFYEIRQYDPFSTCTVQMETSSSSTDSKKKNSAGSAFGSLAGYIFGKNQSSQKMAMTTPVFTTSSETTDGTSKQMSFVLPSAYWTDIDKAPKPMESQNGDTKTSVVSLVKQGAQNRAVLLFGGFASSKEVKVSKKKLLEMVDQDSEWTVKDSTGILEDEKKVVLAQYNDPFTPPWKRRNEVSILVVSRS